MPGNSSKKPQLDKPTTNVV